MTLDELKAEISERISDKNEDLEEYTNRRGGRKGREFYIGQGMLIAYRIIADYLDDLEVII